MKAFTGLLLVAAIVGCGSKPADELGATTQDVQGPKVLLPDGDPCRTVLAPLAVALADGAFGLASSKTTVSRVSSTYVRDYVAEITKDGATVRYAIQLDNDSHSKCLLLSAELDPTATLDDDARTYASLAELDVDVPAFVNPENDYCATTVSLLGRAAAMSSVGRSYVERVDVNLDGPGYLARIDGKSFEASGITFSNDWQYELEVDDECRVERARIKH